MENRNSKKVLGTLLRRVVFVTESFAMMVVVVAVVVVLLLATGTTKLRQLPKELMLHRH